MKVVENERTPNTKECQMNDNKARNKEMELEENSVMEYNE